MIEQAPPKPRPKPQWTRRAKGLEQVGDPAWRVIEKLFRSLATAT
jgi:hypothetical protein